MDQLREAYDIVNQQLQQLQQLRKDKDKDKDKAYEAMAASLASLLEAINDLKGVYTSVDEVRATYEALFAFWLRHPDWQQENARNVQALRTEIETLEKAIYEVLWVLRNALHAIRERTGHPPTGDECNKVCTYLNNWSTTGYLEVSRLARHVDLAYNDAQHSLVQLEGSA